MAWAACKAMHASPCMQPCCLPRSGLHCCPVFAWAIVPCAMHVHARSLIERMLTIMCVFIHIYIYVYIILIPHATRFPEGMSVCLSVCLSASFLNGMSVCLSVCLSVCMVYVCVLHRCALYMGRVISIHSLTYINIYIYIYMYLSIGSRSHLARARPRTPKAQGPGRLHATARSAQASPKRKTWTAKRLPDGKVREVGALSHITQ